MSKLIDADVFKSYIHAGHLRSPTEPCFSENDVCEMIDKQPTVEAYTFPFIKEFVNTVDGVQRIVYECVWWKINTGIMTKTYDTRRDAERGLVDFQKKGIEQIDA